MVLATLAKLSAAEQFFETLSVPFDVEVLNVSRLHILKRFRELIRTTDMDGLEDGAVEAVCRAALIEAYEEFAEGKGRKTFKVFRDAMPGFVPLTELRRG